VSQVIDSLPDCAAARARMQEAVRKLDEASDRVTTEAGRDGVKALRSQLAGPAEACP
jgi:hypothetical protein